MLPTAPLFDVTVEVPDCVIIKSAFTTENGLLIEYSCKKHGILNIDGLLYSEEDEVVGWFNQFNSNVESNAEFLETIRYPSNPGDYWGRL